MKKLAILTFVAISTFTLFSYAATPDFGSDAAQEEKEKKEKKKKKKEKSTPPQGA